MKIKKILKRAGLTILSIAILYLGLLLYPTILFANKISYKNVTVYSDRQIEPEISSVIDEAILRVSKSELYDSSIKFNIYICNDLWRFSIFTQGNKGVGAVCHIYFTGNIFIRPSDIPNNKIIPPKEWYSAKIPFTFSDRPLTYYFAHEMTHKLQVSYKGKLRYFKQPLWLTEGYADYIGKGNDFDFQENLKLWHSNAPELDPKQGLYRLYHLKIAYLIDKKSRTIKDLYNKLPEDKNLNDELWSLKTD